MLKFIGSPISQRNSHKYLIKSAESIPELEDVTVVKIYIEDTFLESKHGEINKIQKRGQSGSFIYTHSIRTRLGDDEYAVNKCQITAREYLILGSNKDIKRKVVKRLRQCFIYENHYIINL